MTPLDWLTPNPFENLWPCPKKRIFKRDPNTTHDAVPGCIGLPTLKKITTNIWDGLDMKLVNGLVTCRQRASPRSGGHRFQRMKYKISIYSIN